MSTALERLKAKRTENQQVVTPVQQKNTVVVDPRAALMQSLKNKQANQPAKPTKPANQGSTWQRLMNDTLFKTEFEKYNKSINNALVQLDERPHEVEGRDAEFDQLTKLMERLDTPIAALIGQAGVGKSALVEGFIKAANHGKVDTVPGRKYFVVSLRMGYLKALGDNGLQAALTEMLPTLKKFEQLAQTRLQDEGIRIILFIDEVHMLITIFGPGTKIGGDLLKDVLARPPIRVIAATTRKEYDASIATDEPLKERFKPIEMIELPQKVVHKICASWWQAHPQVAKYGPLPDEVIDEVLKANKAFRADSAEPRKSLDIMEDLGSYAIRHNKLPGIQQVNDIFYDRFHIQLVRKFDADKVFAAVEKRVKGQAIALYELKRAFRRAAFQLSPNLNKPLLTLMLTGPTGVGKSETTKGIAEGLFDDTSALMNINMPDFKTAESEPVFRKILGETLRHRPDSVVLLDEYEKAHDSVMDSMLAILDEGLVTFEVMNAEGRMEIYKQSLRNCIIVATTNKAAEVFQQSAAFENIKDGFEINDDTQAQYMTLKNNVVKALKDGGMKPEMITRFTRIVPFRQLTAGTYVQLADKIIMEKVKLFKERNNINLILPQREDIRYGKDVYKNTTSLAVYIGAVRTKHDDPSSSGARQLFQSVESLFEDEVIEYIFEHPNARAYEVYVSQDSKLYNYGSALTDGGIKLNAIY